MALTSWLAGMGRAELDRLAREAWDAEYESCREAGMDFEESCLSADEAAEGLWAEYDAACDSARDDAREGRWLG